jgi:hypothetical protein
MAKATESPTTSHFHNLSDGALAEARLARAVAIVEGDDGED